MPYKNKETGNIISDAQYRRLIAEDKPKYIYQDEDEEDASYDSGFSEAIPDPDFDPEEDGYDYDEEEED